jgi:hypothetical protein
MIADVEWGSDSYEEPALTSLLMKATKIFKSIACFEKGEVIEHIHFIYNTEASYVMRNYIKSKAGTRNFVLQ